MALQAYEDEREGMTMISIFLDLKRCSMRSTHAWKLSKSAVGDVLFLSTACATADAMARPTPFPSWKAVFARPPASDFAAGGTAAIILCQRSIHWSALKHWPRGTDSRQSTHAIEIEL